MNRRALFAGALCVGAAAAAQGLKPHRYISLLQSAKLDDLVPRRFGAWTSEDVGDPLAINGPGTLSSKLYNQLVTRAYMDDRGPAILMLLAHGERQSDELQLHRPEICYPAFGYALLRNEPAAVQLTGQIGVPARRLVAKSPSSEQSVVYWTRLGENFPVSFNEQRTARFKDTLEGIIPDGILCRFSIADATSAAWPRLGEFVRGLVAATGQQGRRVLIGTERSRDLQQQLRG
jgi:EpsI family protein